jgi:hypothetical protein
VGTKAADFIKANITGPVNIGQVDFDDQIRKQSKTRWTKPVCSMRKLPGKLRWYLSLFEFVHFVRCRSQALLDSLM